MATMTVTEKYWHRPGARVRQRLPHDRPRPPRCREGDDPGRGQPGGTGHGRSAKASIRKPTRASICGRPRPAPFSKHGAGRRWPPFRPAIPCIVATSISQKSPWRSATGCSSIRCSANSSQVTFRPRSAYRAIDALMSRTTSWPAPCFRPAIRSKCAMRAHARRCCMLSSDRTSGCSHLVVGRDHAGGRRPLRPLRRARHLRRAGARQPGDRAAENGRHLLLRHLPRHGDQPHLSTRRGPPVGDLRDASAGHVRQPRTDTAGVQPTPKYWKFCKRTTTALADPPAPPWGPYGVLSIP